MKDKVIMYQNIRWRKAHNQARRIKGASDKRAAIHQWCNLVKAAINQSEARG